MTTTYKIDPLNGDNYAAWHRRLEWILDDLDLWDVTTGRTAEPIPADAWNVTAAEQQSIDEWRKKDRKARKEICWRVANEQLVYINQNMGAASIWTTLQAIFQSKGAVGIVNLRQDFFRTFAEDGANMEEHVHWLRGIQQELNAQGHYISNDDFSNTLIMSLPSSWSAFITAVNAGGGGMPADVLIAWILDEDRAQKAGTSWQTALKVQQRHKPKKDDAGATKGKCQNCGNKVHYVKDCWAKGGSKEGQAPKWFKQPSKDTANQSEEKEFAFVSKEVAYTALSTSDWLADSAATTHIARNRADFTSYIAKPSEIEGISPDAILRTHSHGSINMEFKIGAKMNTVELCDVKHAPDMPNNLISMGRLTDKNNTATFTGTGVEFKTRAEVIFAQGQKSGCLYKMKVQVT
jgi:gag-polypeptide of LTR copia-type/Pol polyprotein, beta-barrel domain/Domain of unknown function (DUF4219)